MRRRLLLGASFSALATAAQAQVRLFGPQPPGAAIGRHGRPTYGPSPLGVPPPTLDLNFLTGALDPAVTFSRADTTPVASYTDASGTLRYGPTNQTSPSVNTGTWGIVGEGTSTVNNITAPNGTLTGSRLVAGATNAIHAYTLGGGTPAPSAPYTLSVYAKQGAGTTKIGVQLRATDWSGGDVKGAFDLSAVTAAVTTNNGTAAITDVGNGWFRCSITGTSLASGLSGAALWLPVLRADGSETYLGSGETAYFWGVQFEQGPTATAYIPTTAGAASGPRFDYSPATVTNWIRNSTMAGGAAGVYPTGWSESHNTAITPTIVGTGTESGIPYVDIRFNGAATAGNNNIFPESGASVIQALTGQTWTHSVYLRIVGGSTANLGTVFLVLQQRDVSNATLTNFTSNVLGSLNGNPLSGNRYSMTSTLNNAATAFLLPFLQVNPTTGTIDITLRIGAPQLEQSAAANTFVPTSGTFAGSGGTLRGLLIEESRINLAFPSADLVTLFTPSGCTLTAAAGTAPDGALTMTRLVESATNASHYTTKVIASITASATYTVSLFARAGTRQYLQLYYDDGGANGMQATFDLLAGTISGAATARGTGTATGASIQSVGNGVYRCSITGIAGSATSCRFGAALSTTPVPGLAPIYVGDGTSGLLVWGAQMESGAAATSYIPTVAGAVSRLADVATMPVTVPAAYAVAAEVMVPIVINNSIVQGLAVLDDGTANNRVPLRIITAAIGAASVVAGAGTTQPIAAGTVTANTALKGAYSAGAGALTAAFAGGVSAPGSGALPAGLTTLRMGTNAFGGGYLDGWVRRVRYWPQPLTNQQLVQVTT